MTAIESSDSGLQSLAMIDEYWQSIYDNRVDHAQRWADHASRMLTDSNNLVMTDQKRAEVSNDY